MRSPSTKLKATQSKAVKRKYEPAHGRDYEIMARATDEYQTSRTRDRIAYFVLGSVAIAMLLAASDGFHGQNFGAMKDVWTVAGPITGAIVGS